MYMATSCFPENRDLFFITGTIPLFTFINTHWLGQNAQLRQSQAVWLLPSHQPGPDLSAKPHVGGSRAALGAAVREQ